jgi:hypothetical protein
MTPDVMTNLPQIATIIDVLMVSSTPATVFLALDAPFCRTGEFFWPSLFRWAAKQPISIR